MGKTLLSVDWDYFIPIKEEWCGSYIESKRNLENLWYQRYLQYQIKGLDLEKIIDVDPEVEIFWDKVRQHFNFSKNLMVFVSDSHRYSYELAKKYKCKEVFSFDAHADLGYGGLESLDYELNCGNWLGKLLHDGLISGATIVYSPYTYEKIYFFEEINRRYQVSYQQLKDIRKKVRIDIIHICRSGAWTPPWLDDKFEQFVRNLKLNYKVLDCPQREWNLKELNLAKEIEYLLCS